MLDTTAATVPSSPKFTGAKLPIKPMHVWGIRVSFAKRELPVMPKDVAAKLRLDAFEMVLGVEPARKAMAHRNLTG